MLDPGGAAVRERIGSARDSSFCAPELLQSETAAKGIDWQCDMWSIGVIVHLLLVNTLPRFTGWSGSSPFSSASFSQKTVRFSLEDGWRERSAYSRDFIRRLLCEQRKRPTAAQMLHHPWLRRFAPQGTELWPRMTPEKKGALMAGAAEIQLRLLCFMLAVLLAPVMLQSYEVERLQQIFASKDTDSDGYLARAALGMALHGEGPSDDAIARALSMADVFKTGTFDFCSFVVVHLLSGHGFQNSRGRMLAELLQRRVFEAYGDPTSFPPVLAVGELARRTRTGAGRLVSARASVDYDEIFAWLPDDRPVNADMLARSLLEGRGAGTPLGGSGIDEDDDEEIFADCDVESNWSRRWGLGGLNCGCCSKREHSPFSMRIQGY
eukprot:gnl/TRDRNA2_/TRDRNA2_150062_c0_seq2.p1 gnl/TRDRNA2_/TRDRNA2_150062_c0~~gnl/TRDRNA2_/TRDRNA2_150062_c0_seq2.p1  ORF type:complete len:401 (-),score=78.19 gnl/TRDRNA2_/TRDRNA2_150062_c0_seq2:71-1210(-)